MPKLTGHAPFVSSAFCCPTYTPPSDSPIYFPSSCCPILKIEGNKTMQWPPQMGKAQTRDRLHFCSPAITQPAIKYWGDMKDMSAKEGFCLRMEGSKSKGRGQQGMVLGQEQVKLYFSYMWNINLNMNMNTNTHIHIYAHIHVYIYIWNECLRCIIWGEGISWGSKEQRGSVVGE